MDSSGSSLPEILCLRAPPPGRNAPSSATTEPPPPEQQSLLHSVAAPDPYCQMDDILQQQNAQNAPMPPYSQQYLSGTQPLPFMHGQLCGSFNGSNCSSNVNNNSSVPSLGDDYLQPQEASQQRSVPSLSAYISHDVLVLSSKI